VCRAYNALHICFGFCVHEVLYVWNFIYTLDFECKTVKLLIFSQCIQFLSLKFVLLLNSVLSSGPEPVFIKRGIVTVRSLKSSFGEFFQDTPLTDEQIAQLKASLITTLL